MAESRIIRESSSKDEFTVIKNTMLKDPKLSAKAKGILCYIMCLPPDWVLYVSELKKHFTDGRDSITSGINELIKAGYMTKTECRDEQGRYFYDYRAYELSQIDGWYEKPLRESRYGKTVTENPTLLNTNKLNTDELNLSSDEDIDSDESIKEQEAEVIEPTNTDNTVLVDEEVSTVMNDIGMTKASELPKDIDLSWMDSINNDMTDRKDISKTNRSSKRKERKSSAGKKERKPVNTPASRLYNFYCSIAKELVRSGRIAPMQFVEGFKAVNAEYGKLKKTLLARMTEEDAAEYLEYVSHDDWILDNIGFPLDYILSEKTIVNKYNRMIQERKKRQEEYVPPVKKITQLPRCSKCGEEVSAVDGKCPWCNL